MSEALRMLSICSINFIHSLIWMNFPAHTENTWSTFSHQTKGSMCKVSRYISSPQPRLAGDVLLSGASLVVGMLGWYTFYHRVHLFDHFKIVSLGNPLQQQWCFFSKHLFHSWFLTQPSHHCPSETSLEISPANSLKTDRSLFSPPPLLLTPFAC